MVPARYLSDTNQGAFFCLRPTFPSSMTARRLFPLSPEAWQCSNLAFYTPQLSGDPAQLLGGAAPQDGDPRLCFPAGVAIKIPIVCVVLEGGPGTLDVRNCPCPLPGELRGGSGGMEQDWKSLLSWWPGSRAAGLVLAWGAALPALVGTRSSQVKCSRIEMLCCISGRIQDQWGVGGLCMILGPVSLLGCRPSTMPSPMGHPVWL